MKEGAILTMIRAYALAIGLSFVLLGIFSAHNPLALAQGDEFEIERECIAKLFEADFHDLSAENSWVSEVRFSEERGKLAAKVACKGRGEDDSISFEIVEMYPDGSNKEELDEELFEKFGRSLAGDLHDSIHARLRDFVQEEFTPHSGVLGGTVNYHITNCVYSPDESKIAFMVHGDDGHDFFYPSLYVSDVLGYDITRVDSTYSEMCDDMVWASDDELVYAKDGLLWKARIE